MRDETFGRTHGSCGRERDRLLEVLAQYLLVSPGCSWPGSDGMTTGEVVAEAYPAAVRAGYVPARAELTRRHADLSEAIAAFFLPDHAARIAA